MRNNFKKIFSNLLIGFVLSLIFFLPAVCSADTPLERLENVVASQPSYDVDKTTSETVVDYVGQIISVFLGLLGVIFVILIIYGGYLWMTSAGNAEKVSKAGQIIKASILGLLVIVGVYAIWMFLFVRVVQL